MAANLDALYNSPHFRSYWAHRHRRRTEPYAASISDLDRQANQWTERRVLTQTSQRAWGAVNAALGPLRAPLPHPPELTPRVAFPDANYAASLLVQKFFNPTPGSGPSSESAPSISEVGEAGGDSIGTTVSTKRPSCQGTPVLTRPASPSVWLYPTHRPCPHPRQSRQRRQHLGPSGLRASPHAQRQLESNRGAGRIQRTRWRRSPNSR